MTVEEKAKRYDEALERIKKELQACGYTGCDTARQVFKFFPELKESEDERIRKDIIEMLRNWALEHYITKEQFSERMAWLEKQGQKETTYDEDMIQALNACIDAAIKSGMNYISFDSKSILNEKVKNCLKSLSPQNTWKPSDEQIGALEHFVRSIGESGFASPYESNTNLVYSLLSDLKKLKG